jgi:hypothetical protein
VRAGASWFPAFQDPPAESAIWFCVSGVALFLLGQLAHRIESREGRLPAYLGWELLALSLVFGWMIPQSGFLPILLPQAVFMIVRKRRTA